MGTNTRRERRDRGAERGGGGGGEEEVHILILKVASRLIKS